MIIVIEMEGKEMIVKLLDYLNEGNDFSDAAVQRGLGLSEFMAQTYKEQLIRGGYLKKAPGLDCNSACSSCSHKCSAASMTDNNAIMWEITDKGYNVIKKAKVG